MPNEDDSLMLTVTRASGLNYQWQHDGNDIEIGEDGQAVYTERTRLNRAFFVRVITQETP
ncbi:MAG: hypothetical protein M2R45_04732 [Verrucomicrobia subdivision 3 bacterium]|nr:hypothetical protein [Limisphaerales bacterium]MCS1415752.1 hypothetical protein [Limisphaerales bacterium]